MKFQLMSTFWQDKYTDWFKKGCFESMTWTENKKAILDHCSVWNINTEERFFPEIMELMESAFPGLKVKLRNTDELRRYVDVLQSALVLQIEQCLDTGDAFLFAPPDTIFADGTVESLRIIGQEPKACVAIAHPRVLPNVLNELKPCSSPQMVNLAFRNLHRSWTDAQSGHPRQSSFISGVSWEELEPSLYSITHRLPTTYYANFVPEDLVYFKTCIGFGNFDHEWPTTLYNSGRIRYVGSSYGGFVCEVTDSDKNVPPVRPGDVDGFWANHMHNHCAKQCKVIFRGEA